MKRFLFYFFFSSFVTISLSVKCDAKDISLSVADSLFNKKKYTEALEIYITLERKGISTSSMYLKMAYINEALENIPGTLYFLNKYYLISKNKVALKKMENLAKENGLEGFEYSDKEFLENLVLKYGAGISLFLVAILVLSFFTLVYRNFVLHKRSPTFQFIVLSITIIVLINSNIRLNKSYGIVNSPFSFLMSSPSAGSDVIEEVKPGCRFLINGGNEVWLKLKGNGIYGYIRKNDLLIVNEKQPIFLWLVDRI